MRILHSIIPVLAFVLFFSENYAQNYADLLNGRYYYLPQVSLKDTGQKVNFYELRFVSTIPVELKNGNMIGVKPSYDMYSLKTDNPELKDLQLHTLKLPVFLYWKFSDSKWASYVDVSPKLNSDLENISSRHFQIGGMVLMYYEKREDFVWQFGVFYNQDTYGPFIMPLLGLYLVGENSYFEALLPAYVIYERKLSPKIYAGFELELRGETFRLGGSEYEDSFISQLGENKLTFLTEPRLFIDFYLTKHVVLYLKPGLRLFHKFEHYTEDDQRIEHSEYVQGTLENSFYAEIGMAFRFRYDEE
ncbi:MAG: DUF6268 family outer membrane beta-barrel protein [Bacteroidales bacterium]|jgi:hypothetical protein